MLLLPYVSTMGTREGEGAQARAYGKGGQAGGRGQEQGASRLDGTERAGKLARGCRWRRHPTGKVKLDAAPGCKLPDGAPQNKNLNYFFLYIQLQLSINILL